MSRQVDEQADGLECSHAGRREDGPAGSAVQYGSGAGRENAYLASREWKMRKTLPTGKDRCHRGRCKRDGTSGRE